MATNVQYEIPTWNQIYDMLLSQTRKIQVFPYKVDVVVAVARGGLVPGRILADLLETPQLSTMQIEFYIGIGEAMSEPRLKQPLTVSVVGKRVLLVDDIVDSGRSLELAKTHLQAQGAAEVKTAVLYYKLQSAEKPDFYEKSTSSWVIFPWDTKETLRKILQSQAGKRQVNAEVAKIVKAGLPKKLTEKLLEDMQ
ncbi:MAG: phosphoribosyltransferase [Candidatus Bathyarchaeia archaeon]|jgi:hypoxanthine phosphoribosyltransferase